MKYSKINLEVGYFLISSYGLRQLILTGDQSNNSLLWIDGLDTTSQAEYEKDGWDALQVVYSNGKLTKETTLADIREKLQ